MQVRTHTRRAGARRSVAVIGLLSCSAVHQSQAADAAVASAPAASAASAPAVPERRLDAVTITGTRSQRAARDVPASISVIGSRQLELRPSLSSGDELAVVPGLLLTRENGGMDNGVTIRGVPGRHGNDNFLVLVDGVPQMNMSGEAALDVLPPGVVRQVEVVKGPMSAMYGRGGVSGAVNYLTLNPFRDEQSVVGVEAGSHGFLRPYATAARPLSDQLAVVASGTVTRSDGAYEHNERRANSAFFKATWLPTDTTSLTAWFSHYRNHQELPGDIPLNPDASLMNVRREARTQIPDAYGLRQSDLGSLAWEQQLAPGWRLKLNGSHALRRTRDTVGALQDFDDAAGTIDWLGVDAADRNQTSILDAQLSGQAGAHRVVAGATFERMRGSGNASVRGEPFDGINPMPFYTQTIDVATGAIVNGGAFETASALDFQSTSRVWGLFAQDEIDLGGGWSATLGLRHDRFKRKVDYLESLFTSAATVQGEGSHTSPKLALSVKLAPTATLYAAFGEGFNPTFGPPIAFIARPETLNPEIARGYEIGAKGELGDVVSYAVSLYRLDRKDLAEWIVPSGGGALAFSNVGRQRSDGVELETDWNLAAVNAGLRGYLNYAYTHSTWRSKDFVDPDTSVEYRFTGKMVPGVPKHTAAAGLSQAIGEGWLVYGGVESTSPYWVDYQNTIRKGARDLWHAGVRYRTPARGLEVQLLVRNLFDRELFHYASDPGGPSTATRFDPRTVTLTLAYRF